jgi:phosphoribosylformylglycinamidine synthase I
MKAAIIVFPGTNRERDIADALTLAMGEPPITVWHADADMPTVDLIVVPGGFAYGDYLRSGAMAAHSPILREVVARATRGVAVLGVCNGFQILTEAGLLPGVLMRNATLRFICRDVHLAVESSQSIFTNRYEAGRVVRFPVAHFDGNYFADDATLDRLEGEGRVAFRYCTPEGAVSDEGNPNGSIRNIAGIYNETKTILGMMPHPENAIRATLGNDDGKALFEGLTAALA